MSAKDIEMRASAKRLWFSLYTLSLGIAFGLLAPQIWSSGDWINQGFALFLWLAAVLLVVLSVATFLMPAQEPKSRGRL